MYRLKQMLFLVFFVSNVLSEEKDEKQFILSMPTPHTGEDGLIRKPTYPTKTMNQRRLLDGPQKKELALSGRHSSHLRSSFTFSIDLSPLLARLNRSLPSPNRLAQFLPAYHQATQQHTENKPKMGSSDLWSSHGNSEAKKENIKRANKIWRNLITLVFGAHLC